MEHRVFWFLRVGKAGKMLHPYLILLLLFHSAAVFAQSGQKGGQNWGLGPVQLDDQFPLALFHAGLKADTPEVLPKGQSSFRSSFAWSNTDNVKKSSYQVDAEVRSATFAYSLGVFDNFQVGLEIPIIWTGGGILDPFIYQWHDFFSLPQGPRDEGSDDEFIIQGRNRDGTTFNIAESGTVIGDLVLSGKMLLTGGDDVMPAVSLSEQIRLPSGEEPYSQDAFDNVFSILASKRWYRWTAYLGAGYIFIGDDEENNLSFYQHRGSGFSTIEYFLSNQWTVFTTFQYSSALVKDVERFPDYELYWDIGSKYLFSDKIMLELMFRENPAPDRGTCDITFFAGVTVY